MSAHVQACVAEAEAAGWTGAALQRLVIDPRAATEKGFRDLLTEANGIRALVKIVAPDMRALGYDTDSALSDFIAKGYSIERIRNDTARVMAEENEATAIDTTRRARASIDDPYAARAAQIDAHKGNVR